MMERRQDAYPVIIPAFAKATAGPARLNLVAGGAAGSQQELEGVQDAAVGAHFVVQV